MQMIMGAVNGESWFFSAYSRSVRSIMMRHAARYDLESGRWYLPLPLTKALIDELESKGHEIEGKEQARTALSRLYNQLGLSTAPNLDAWPNAPDMPAELRPYQQVGVLMAAHECDGRCLLADEQGLGKTVQAIVAMEALQARRVVVVAPNSLHENWRREIETWTGRRAYVNKSGSDEKTRDEAIAIVSYGCAGKVELGQRDGLIIDEAHYVKNPSSSRHRAVVAIADQCRYVLALTGTPIFSMAAELWALMRVVKGERCMSYDAYKYRYGGALKGKNGQVFYRPPNHQKELNLLLRSFSVRRTKSQVLKDLPALTKQVVYLRQADGMTFIESRIRDLLGKYDSPADLIKAIARGRIKLGGDIFRSYTDNAEERLDDALLFDYVRDALADGEKTLIFAKHRAMIAKLEAELAADGRQSITIHGDIPVKKRQELVDQFNAEKKMSAAVLSLMAAREGLNLQSASRVIFAELDWAPAILSQAESRAHRFGQRNPVTAHLLIATAFDDLLHQVIAFKAANVAAIVDGGQSGSGESRFIADLVEMVAKKLEAEKKDAPESPRIDDLVAGGMIAPPQSIVESSAFGSQPSRPTSAAALS